MERTVDLRSWCCQWAQFEKEGTQNLPKTLAVSLAASCTACTRGFHIFHQQRAQQERGQYIPWLVLVSPVAFHMKFGSTFWIQRLVPGKGQCHILSVRPELIPCRDGRYEENQAGIPKQRYAAIWYTNKKCKFRLYLLVKCSIHLLLMVQSEIWHNCDGHLDTKASLPGYTRCPPLWPLLANHGRFQRNPEKRRHVAPRMGFQPKIGVESQNAADISALCVMYCYMM